MSQFTVTDQTIASEYIKEYMDYLDNCIDYSHSLTQLRTCDLSLQECYRRVKELVHHLQVENNSGLESHDSRHCQTMLINALVQAKIIGDNKMRLSQQILDATEKKAKTLKDAFHKYNESIDQHNGSSSDNNLEYDSDNGYDSESGLRSSHYSKHDLKRDSAATSLWKRKPTSLSSTMNLKRRCNDQHDKSNANDHDSHQHSRDRKKSSQRHTVNNNQSTSCGGSNGNKKPKLNETVVFMNSEEPTYCLCSQESYGEMICCDNKACEFEWFHFNCVNLTTKPKGKWYCPRCRVPGENSRQLRKDFKKTKNNNFSNANNTLQQNNLLPMKE